MDISSHDIYALFLQLGLPNRSENIEVFIEQHQPLASEIPFDRAPFWTPAQVDFVREAIAQDSEWCGTVDVLDTRLRK